MASLGAEMSFWKGRRVFLTGHTGFKGGWLALWLQELGAEVYGYALPAPTTPNLFASARVAEGMAVSTIADIRDAAAVAAALKAVRPEIVFHMAAQSLVRASYLNPVETYEVNVLGTAHLLEGVRSTPGIRVVLNVTSDKCYENREWEWGYRESDPMGGADPYSSSKGCAELVTAAYRRSFLGPSGVKLATVRAGNVIGGGDWATDRLIPDFVRAIQAGESARIRNPHAIRPWQHVLEPLSGYLRLAEELWDNDAPEASGGWNFGPDDSDARSVEWVATQLVELWGEGASWARDPGPHPHEAMYLKLDCSRAHLRLGWRPRWSLSEALGRVVDWYRRFYAGHDVRAVTRAQVREYLAAGAATR